MRYTVFHDKSKAPLTSLPTAKKDVATEDKKTSKNLSWLSRQQSPDILRHRKNKRKALCPNRADISYLKTTKQHRTDDQKLICQVYLQPIEMLSPAKKTIISYLSNKYLWTKCLLVTKTNKTGTTACYLRRKKFLLNTVRLYQHIKTNNHSVFFGIVYQSANREEQYTLNQKSSYTHPLRHARSKITVKKTRHLVNQPNPQTKNFQAKPHTSDEVLLHIIGFSALFHVYKPFYD